MCISKIFIITSSNSPSSSPFQEKKNTAALNSPSVPLNSAITVATVSPQSSPSMNNDTIRLLAASGPLIQPNFSSGLQRPPIIPPTMAAAAAGMDQANQYNRAMQAQAQMIAMCQNMPPVIFLMIYNC